MAPEDIRRRRYLQEYRSVDGQDDVAEAMKQRRLNDEGCLEIGAKRNSSCKNPTSR